MKKLGQLIRNSKKTDWLMLYVWSLGIITLLIYFIKTDFDVRTYDLLEGGGHLDYIKYLFEKWQLPPPHIGWQYHHPPLYYVSGAFLFGTLSGFTPAVLYKGLQLLSLVYYLGFLVVAARIYQLVLNKRWQIHTATLLTIFWPSGIIHSVRIGNDPMFYFLFSLSIYQLITWIKTDKEEALKKALVIAGLTIVTKSNGLILLPIIVFCLVMKYRGGLRVNFLNFVKKHLVGILSVLTGLVINFGDNIYYYLRDSRFDWLNSSIYMLNSDLRVGNSLSNYLQFDYSTYFRQPFISTWLDETGRQYFWNFLLKSSLFAEFNFSNPVNHWIALILSFFLLIIILLSTLTLIGIIVKRKLRKILNVSIVISLFFLILGLIYFRYKMPYSPHADFRYIYPAIIPLIILLVKTGEVIEAKKIPFIKATVVVTGHLFALLSIMFIYNI